MPATIDKVIHDFDELAFEDQEFVKELIDKRLIEAQRAQILKEAKEGRREFDEGKTKTFDNVSDLMKSLDED